jgi:hypothetical protein
MTDYCLKNTDEAEFDQLMLDTGLCVKDEDGNVVPASYEVLLDKIGPITMVTGYDENGDPITETYPEYYSNLRLLFEPSEDQVAALTVFAVDPSQPQYRVWA